MDVNKKIKLNDGNFMPLLGLGTWKAEYITAEQCQAAAETAIAAGYRHVDMAFAYQNEEELGRAIRCSIEKGIVKRQDLFIVSKLWCTYFAPEDIPLGLNKTLSDLQLDYVDLYLMHFPVGLKRIGDKLFPEENGVLQMSDVDYVDVWRGMEALKATGKVKSIGVSNFSIKQLERLLSVAKVPPAVNQVELHPYLVQSDLIEYCKSKNIALTAYCPFGSPDKPKSFHKGDKDPEKLLVDPVVGKIAAKHNRTPAQVLLRYHIEQGVAVIPKSSIPSQILENGKVFDFSLDEEDMKALKSLNRGWKVALMEQFESHPNYPFK